MSLLSNTWLNLTRRLWDQEVVAKLDSHVRLTNEDGSVIVPVSNPHPQYFNLVVDTAWMGMHLSVGSLITQGDVVKPYNEMLYPAYGLIPNLADGTVTIDVTKGGGYLFAIYFAFMAVSNGGEFTFRVYLNGEMTNLATVADLSNQSDIGTGVITGFFPINANSYPLVADLRLESATKDVTMLDSVWTMSRMFPDIVFGPAPTQIVEYLGDAVIHNGDQVVH